MQRTETVKLIVSVQLLSHHAVIVGRCSFLVDVYRVLEAGYTLATDRMYSALASVSMSFVVFYHLLISECVDCFLTPHGQIYIASQPHTSLYYHIHICWCCRLATARASDLVVHVYCILSVWRHFLTQCYLNTFCRFFCPFSVSADELLCSLIFRCNNITF